MPQVALNGFAARDYPFKNFLKHAGGMNAQNGIYAFPPVLDANGYPTTAPGNTLQFQIGMPTSYTGTWRFYWQGQFKINLAIGGGVFTEVADPSASATGSGSANLVITASTNSYVDFTMSGAPSIITLQYFTAATYSSGIQMVLCRVSAPYTGDQAAIDSGVLKEQFNDDFIAKLTQLNPATLRPLVCFNPDDRQNFSRWDYRKPVNACSYYASRWHPGLIAGDSGSGAMKTLNTGDAYSITSYPDMSGSWTDGETIHFQVSATNTTTTPTLDVGGRGAKTITDMWGTDIDAGVMIANALVSVTYDAVINKLMFYAGGVKTEWPVEMLCALANKLRKPFRLAIPTHFNLASVQSLVAAVRDNLDSDLTLELAYSNEIWNFFAGFEQTGWADVYGAALGIPSGSNRRLHSTYGLRVAQFMPAAATVWTSGGRSRSTLRTIAEFQLFGATSEINLYRLKGDDLSTSKGYAGYNSIVGVNYNASPNRPVDVVDAISYATYYSGAQCEKTDGSFDNTSNGLNTGGPSGWTTGLLGAADAFALGGETNIANAFAFMDWDVRQGTHHGVAGGETVAAITPKYAGFETIAAEYDGARPAGKSNLTILLYEGGFEGWYPSQSRCTAIGINVAYGDATGKIALLLDAYKRSTQFCQLVMDQFAAVEAASPGRTVVPSWFIFNQVDSNWSMYPGPDSYTTPYQSWDAVALSNNNKRRMVITT